MTMQGFLRGVHSLLMPGSCVGCGLSLAQSQKSPLCPVCIKVLPRSKPPWCVTCGRSLAGLGVGIDCCLNCRGHHPAFDQVISPCRYEGVIKEMIVAFKYQKQLSLAPFFGELLAESVRERLGFDPADGIVPVPLHPPRFRERTFNQAERLAEELAENVNLPCWDHSLFRWKPTRSQAELDRAERLTNVQEAFELQANPFLRLSRILLVDDVFTTGATVNACAQLLKQGGALSVTVVTVAHG